MLSVTSTDVAPIDVVLYASFVLTSLLSTYSTKINYLLGQCSKAYTMAKRTFPFICVVYPWCPWRILLNRSNIFCLYFVLGRIVVPRLHNRIKGWRVWAGEQTSCQLYLSTSISEARGRQFFFGKLHDSMCVSFYFYISRNEMETQRFNYSTALQEN